MDKLIHTPEGQLKLDDPYVPGTRVIWIGMSGAMDTPATIIELPPGETHHPDYLWVRFNDGDGTLRENKKFFKLADD